MRHRVKGHKIGRTASHRKATLSALATGLILNKKIKTTHAKARALRPYIESMISKAKVDSVHNRRLVSESIHDKEAVKTLFSEVAEKVGERPGGYTRIVKLGQRQGDAAAMSIIELVDFSEVNAKKSAKKKTKKETPAPEVEVAPAESEEVKDAEVVEETVEEEKAEATETAEAEVENPEVEEIAEAEEVKEETTSEEIEEAKENSSDKAEEAPKEKASEEESEKKKEE